MTLRLSTERLTKVGRHLPAIFVFSVMLVFVTWPLILHLGSGMIGSTVGDGWEVVEQIWWYKHAVVDLRISPLYDPNVFYPAGWYTASGSYSFMLMLPTIPLTAAIGSVATYNLMMLWSFMLAAVGTYVLIYHLTRDRLAGILGGISYAFCMSRLLRLGGHYHTSIGSAWLPWIFVCLEQVRKCDTRRKRVVWTILAGVCYAFAIYGYWYFVYIVAIPLGAYFAIELWQVRHIRAQVKSILGTVLLIFGVVGVLVAPFALVTLQARNLAGIEPFSLEATKPYAASPEKFLLPNRYNPIWGPWLSARFPDKGEQDFVFLGLAAIGLTVVAVVRRVHPRTSSYFAVAVAGLVLAMGPELLWNGVPVQISGPGRDPGAAVPLPGLLFYTFFPMFNVIRTWARFSLAGSFGVGVLAGLGLMYFRRRVRYKRMALFFSWVLIAIVILESVGQPFGFVSTNVMEREVDRWLAAQPGEFAIMELPLNDRLNGSLQYSRMLHDKTLAMGYTTAMPRAFMEAVPSFLAFPNQKTIKLLQRWRVRYLLYTVRDPAVFRTEIAPAIARLQGLTRVGEFGGYPGERVYVYEVSTG